jgi:Bacterial conjugation TrbI-like protein
MRQKIKDLVLLLQKDTKVQLITVIAVGMVLWLMYDASKGTRTRIVTEEAEVIGKTSSTDEAYNDIVRAFGSELENTKGEVSRIHTRLDEQEQKFEEFQTSSTEIFRKILERMSEIENVAPGAATGPGFEPGSASGTDVAGLEAPSDVLESFGNQATTPDVPPAPEKEQVAFIGAGDSVRIKLLAGVNAPTNGTPYPVVFQLLSDVMGPDNSQLPLGEARIVAAAQGSLTDSRALFRITSMNIRLPNGRRKVVPVDGWVVGEDGVRGMEGILIDPIGKAIGGAGFAGALQGFGQGIAATNVTVNNQGSVFGSSATVTGDALEFGAGMGLSRAAQVYANLIQQRVGELVPVVQVLSGREATAVFSRSVSIPDLYAALDAEDSGFVGLD